MNFNTSKGEVYDAMDISLVVSLFLIKLKEIYKLNM